MKLYVPLTLEEFDALCEVAHAEKRRPQDQAAILILAGLRLTSATHYVQGWPVEADAPVEEPLGG